MTQTWALLVDSYRELNARRLFWVVLVISALIVGAFAAVGINDRGLTVLWWEFPAPFNSTWIEPGEFYKLMYVNLGVKIWLGWAAAILALISTAAIIPDFVSGGAIELTLCRPLGRVRLLLTKYFGSLLFVGLQVGAFTLASFLVIGLRGGSWEPKLFLSIPLVTLFFSYLYCVCALLGLLTRSSIAALLLTIGFWLATFGLNTTDDVLLGMRVQKTLEIESGERQRERALKQIEELSAPPPPAEPGAAAGSGGAGGDPTQDEAKAVKRAADLERRQERLADIEKGLSEVRAALIPIERWHRRVFVLKTIFPKTSETTGLNERWMTQSVNQKIAGRQESDQPVNAAPFGTPRFNIKLAEFAQRVEAEKASRTTLWIIGTSVLFEAAVLGLACWIFARRDF